MLKIPTPIKTAIRDRAPLVALESTVISHGLPYPANVEVTRDMLSCIRQAGAIPAVIGLLEGQIVIGLSDSEIERFAQEKDVFKVSRGDISFCLQQRRTGATTVSATMYAASQAGIKIFATGGLGGVHRGVETSFDISTDLFELSQTNVAVVCSGVKSILDVPKTLEYLETMGVPLIGYKTHHFPLFYAAEGPVLNKKIDSPQEAAEIIHMQSQLSLKGLVIANPIPAQYSLEVNDVEASILEAEKCREEQGITGKAVTPFLLKKLGELTDGRTLKANVELLKNNARVAAEIAVKLAKIAPDF